MARLTFVEPDGNVRMIEVENGLSIMEGAVRHGIKGILAQCGGTCSCSTCHCYVNPGWLDRLPPKTAAETSLIDFVWEPRTNSRLTCQITVTEELDGLVLHVPARQLS